ncbi:MAG: preprotein translocase subunit YajC [Bacillota bacterium]|jgi:preprotein translocase subunit YajC
MDAQIGTILYIVALFALLYFLLIRPQQQRQKKHKQMIDSLRLNDPVVTAGGMYGTIVKLKEDSVILKVADNVRIEFMKSAIAQVRSDSEGDREKD